MRNDRGNVECRFVAGNLWWQVAWCGVSETTIHSLRSNWPGARREGRSVSAAILDRLSNEAPGQFQRNPEGGMSFGRRRCCSLLTDPLRDMLWCPCGSTSRLASAQNPLPRMYSYFGDTTLAVGKQLPLSDSSDEIQRCVFERWLKVIQTAGDPHHQNPAVPGKQSYHRSFVRQYTIA